MKNISPYQLSFNYGWSDENLLSRDWKVDPKIAQGVIAGKMKHSIELYDIKNVLNVIFLFKSIFRQYAKSAHPLACL
jgi:hypothetical protein